MKRDESRRNRCRFIGCLVIAVSTTAFLAIQIGRYFQDGGSLLGNASVPQQDLLGRGTRYEGPLLALILILASSIVCWVGVVDYLRNRRGRK